MLGCRPAEVQHPQGSSVRPTPHDTSFVTSLTFIVPDQVRKILKRKCFICHGADDPKGGFDFRNMIYKPNEEAETEWIAMDLAGATRIKLAILPIDGKSPVMPKKAGSILNSLTVDEANTIAQWTDFPFER